MRQGAFHTAKSQVKTPMNHSSDQRCVKGKCCCGKFFVSLFLLHMESRVCSVGKVMTSERVDTVNGTEVKNCVYLPWMSSAGWTWCLESAGAATRRSPSHWSQSSLIRWRKESLNKSEKKKNSSICVQRKGNFRLKPHGSVTAKRNRSTSQGFMRAAKWTASVHTPVASLSVA